MITTPIKEDGLLIHAVNAATSVFTPEEVECVDELWDENQAEGPENSGYYFIVDKEDGQIMGYTCYGPRALTDRTYDLYWIAVDPPYAGQGIGTHLLQRIEELVLAANGRLIVIETSSSSEYAAPRQFYLKNGYNLAETIRDFYRDGEDRVTYVKRVEDC